MQLTREAIAQSAPLPPWYYGAAYVEFYAEQMVYYPLPWNYLVRAQRAVARQWDRWRARSLSTYDQRVLRMLGYWRRRAFARGFEQGREHGMQFVAEIVRQQENGFEDQKDRG